jgi:hypothetical protein
MALDDVKDNLKEQAKAIWSRVRESDAYLQLSEKYQSLSPDGQKAALALSLVVGFLIVMAVPWSFYSSSQTSVEDYEVKRDLVRELFKVNRETAGLPPAPAPIGASELEGLARQNLSNARLVPEQIVGVTETPANVAGIAKTIEQTGIAVSLSKVNLKQIVDIGNDLQNMQSTARMMGLEIKASAADSRYYDVVYKIVAFAAKPDVAPKKGPKK